MERNALIGCLSFGVVAVIACGQEFSNSADNETFTAQEWSKVNSLSPLPDLPVNTTNKYRDSAAAALLGQKLFFEPRLSGPSKPGL